MNRAEPVRESAIDPGITLGVEKASRWARATAVVLGVNAAISGAALMTAIVQAIAYRHGTAGETVDDGREIAAAFSSAFASLSFLGVTALVLGAIVFVRWTSTVFNVAPRLLPPGSRELREFPASRVVSSFFIPIANLVRPYHAFAALGEALDPADLPVPRPQANAGEIAGGYRDAAAAPIPERVPAPRPEVGLWWAFWVGRIPLSWILRAFATENPIGSALADPMILNLVEMIAAILAIRVVLRIDAQLQERHRRIAFADKGF